MYRATNLLCSFIFVNVNDSVHEIFDCKLIWATGDTFEIQEETCDLQAAEDFSICF